jgi:hypothetical protein
VTAAVITAGAVEVKQQVTSSPANSGVNSATERRQCRPPATSHGRPIPVAADASEVSTDTVVADVVPDVR